MAHQAPHRAGPWGSGLPGPVSTPLSDWREGLRSPSKVWVHSKLKEPIGHPTPETLRTGCTYPSYFCPTHPPRHTYNLFSGSIKTLNSLHFHPQPLELNPLSPIFQGQWLSYQLIPHRHHCWTREPSLVTGSSSAVPFLPGNVTAHGKWLCL